MSRSHYFAHVDGQQIVGKCDSLMTSFDIPTAEMMVVTFRRQADEHAKAGRLVLAESNLDLADELEAALKDAERQRAAMAEITRRAA